jgi:hypothetical protein
VRGFSRTASLFTAKTDCLLEQAGFAQACNNNRLNWQTGLSAEIDTKGFSGAVANLPAGGSGRPSNPPARWHWGGFRVSTEAGPQGRYGSFWKHWGIHRTPDKWYAVTHLPSGCRLTAFHQLRCARRFCETIESLTHWSVTAPSPSVALQVHRAALQVTGARPALTCIQAAE